jgi:hypothetical protein
MQEEKQFVLLIVLLFDIWYNLMVILFFQLLDSGKVKSFGIIGRETQLIMS